MYYVQLTCAPIPAWCYPQAMDSIIQTTTCTSLLTLARTWRKLLTKIDNNENNTKLERAILMCQIMTSGDWMDLNQTIFYINVFYIMFMAYYGHIYTGRRRRPSIVYNVYYNVHEETSCTCQYVTLYFMIEIHLYVVKNRSK